ncbi:mannosyltransferase [Microbotryomycetes sp. JL201]|nr:mannosyltransferase [Microbotryomycetes sp. JL201]
MASPAGFNIPAAQQLRFRGRTAPSRDASKVPVAAKAASSASRPLIVDASRLPGWTPNWVTAARMLIIVRWYAAMCSNISDCDEVFNYWEPLHYLWRGVGFQTWEYSPAYAIRSYFYLLVNALPLGIAQLFASKRVAFFAIRLSFATVSTFAEAKFYRSVAEHINPHVGRYVLFSLLFSPGLFASATSFLPSTFAMWATLLGSAAALAPVDSSRRRITSLVTAFGIGAVVGWPFAAALAAPSIVEYLLPNRPSVVAARFRQLVLASIPTLLVLVAAIATDSKAYQHLTLVPWNIVKYNAFPTKGSGPALYGEEPFSFYFVNASLQFNVLFPLALLSLPAIWITRQVDPKRFRPWPGSATSMATSLVVRLLPMHLWLLLLSFQPHKEERFLYPAYGYIALNAATTLYLLRCCLQQAYLKVTNSPFRTGRSPVFALFTTAVMAVFATLSISRIAANYMYYHAPLDIYAQFEGYELPRLALQMYPSLYPAAQSVDPSLPLEDFANALDKAEQLIELDPLDGLGLRLCLGKEWYRFPGHFLVPDPVEVRFVQSAFNGILPKVWDVSDQSQRGSGNKSQIGHGLFGRSTHLVPSGMNSMNQHEPDRYVPASTCHYMVDLDLSVLAEEPNALEPNYGQRAEWEQVLCLPFLINQKSARWTRSFYVPLPAWQQQNTFGQYCLLRNKHLLQ